MHGTKPKGNDMSAMKKWFPSPWLSAADITENEIVTIKEVKEEIVGKDQELKPALYLVENDKATILNKTNAFEVVHAYGDDETKWPGKKLMLFTERVRNPQTGLIAPAVRMTVPPKAPAPTPAKAPAPTPAVEAAEEGAWDSETPPNDGSSD
jgi:hypothetical protein